MAPFQKAMTGGVQAWYGTSAAGKGKSDLTRYSYVNCTITGLLCLQFAILEIILRICRFPVISIFLTLSQSSWLRVCDLKDYFALSFESLETYLVPKIYERWYKILQLAFYSLVLQVKELNPTQIGHHPHGHEQGVCGVNSRLICTLSSSPTALWSVFHPSENQSAKRRDYPGSRGSFSSCEESAYLRFHFLGKPTLDVRICMANVEITQQRWIYLAYSTMF